MAILIDHKSNDSNDITRVQYMYASKPEVGTWYDDKYLIRTINNSSKTFDHETNYISK
jgi:hypothetical protein